MADPAYFRGETASFSSSKRKNRDRSVGSKCDMIFRKSVCNQEFEATETGKDYNGDDTTKRLFEGCIKLPKCLKDMLDNLAKNIQAMADIEVVGLISFFYLSPSKKV